MYESVHLARFGNQCAVTDMGMIYKFGCFQMKVFSHSNQKWSDIQDITDTIADVASAPEGKYVQIEGERGDRREHA